MSNEAGARISGTKIALAIAEMGLCVPRGGTLERRMNTEKSSVFFRVGFSLPTALDGEVNIYSPGWIRVWFALGRPGPLSGEQSFVFAPKEKNKRGGTPQDFTDTVIAFLRTAFLDGEQSKAMELLP